MLVSSVDRLVTCWICAIWLVTWALSIGLSGSWLFIWATSSLRNRSCVSAAFLAEVVWGAVLVPLSAVMSMACLQFSGQD